MPTASGHTKAILASRVQGTDVYNKAGESIGEVKDIVLDKTSNQIMYAVVGFGGYPSVAPVLAAQRLDLAGITVPVLTLYSRHDDVIRLDLVAANHARFGSPLKEIVDLPEATRHELASDALVPAAVDPAVRVMLDFSRRALAAR